MWSEKCLSIILVEQEMFKDRQKKRALQKVMRGSNQRARRKIRRVCPNGSMLRGRSYQPPQMLLRVQIRLKFIVFSSKEVICDLLRAVLNL